nr:MAG TPA: hypothetical protein [Caudoviricetes sp.]DAT86923.1 MAG TPA: hypothetical protein [Caudoviricetes sp.]
MIAPRLYLSQPYVLIISLLEIKVNPFLTKFLIYFKIF